MKLGLIRRRFSPTGGAELYLQRIMSSLAQSGHEVHLFTESWQEPPADVRIHPIHTSGSRAGAPLRFAAAVDGALAKQQSFDCVFSFERTLRQDLYRAGDGVHRVWLRRRRQYAPVWKRWLVGRGLFHRYLLRLEARTLDPHNTRRIIVNSEMVRREIVNEFRFPADRIHLVRNGVATHRIACGRRDETRARYGVQRDETLVLFAGSGWERKGLTFVIQAVDRLAAGSCFPPIKLLVAGKGSAPSGSASHILFPGPVSDIENVYAAADVFAFLPIYEPSSNVVYEALAAGLPVVTSAFNGASEVIQEGVNGTVLGDTSDIAAAAEAIRHWASKGRANLPQGCLLGFDPSMERNVSETLEVVKLCVQERAR